MGPVHAGASGNRAGALGLARAAAMVAAMLASAALAAAPADPQQAAAAVRPGDDFYRYANGYWLSATPLPEGRSSYDTTAMLRDQNAQRVRDLVKAAAKAPASARERRIGDYYGAFLDVAGIEAKGLAPISGELAAIAAIRDRHALSAWLGGALRPDDGTNTRTDGLFGVWIHQGFHDPDRYAAHLVQGGLGLPDREDYLDPSAGTAARRQIYQAHIAAMLKLAGFDRPAGRASGVLALEAAIAATHASRADTDDVFKTDNPWRRADFATKAPGLDWDAYFEAAGLDGQREIIVWQPSAVTGAAALVGAQPLETWKDYLAFHLLDHYGPVLPRAFREEETAFEGRLSGQPAPAADRGQQALEAATEALGEDIGRLYVERYFPPRAKAAAAVMAENIRAAFRARIARLSWMSPATRAAALAKLEALKIGVGYPDGWTDYSGLAVARGDAYGDLRRAEAFAWRRGLARLARSVDPAEWSGLYPQQPGALINFSPNSLQFSAGILQPPYFDPLGDAASNYGSAGAGMAHEISHSFDELGAIYDARGRLVRWWTPEDLARYRAATAPLAAQFDAYCPRTGLCVNGRQVVGEAGGDLAGLVVAHDAYLLSLGGRPDVVKEGLTGEKRFFLAFARRWRRLQTDEALRRQIAADTHPPAEYRADMVRQHEAWLRAFEVQPGDRLYLAPEARAQVW